MMVNLALVSAYCLKIYSAADFTVIGTPACLLLESRLTVQVLCVAASDDQDCKHFRVSQLHLHSILCVFMPLFSSC